MAIIESTLGSLFLSYLLDKGKDFLTKKSFDTVFDISKKEFNKNTLNAFELEINQCFNSAKTDFLNKYFQYKNRDETFFFNSMKFWELLIQASLNNELKLPELEKEILKDSRIEKFTTDELQYFIDLFNQQVSSNPKISKLNIEINYKKTISEIKNDTSEILKNQQEQGNQLSNIQNRIEELLSNTNNQKVKAILLERVATLKQYIETFRIVTAKLEIQDILQNYISELDGKIIGELYFMLAQCQSLLNENALESYLNSSKYLTENYLVKAQVGFYELNRNNHEVALNIANEILIEEKANPFANALFGIITYGDDIDKIVSVYSSDFINDVKFTFPFFTSHIHKQSTNIVNIASLLKLDKFEDTNVDSLVIKPENLTFWYIYTQYLVHKYFLIEKDQEYGKAVIGNKLFELILDLLNKFCDTIENSELKPFYLNFYFIRAYFNWNKDKSIINVGLVEDIFKKLDVMSIIPQYYMLLLEVFTYTDSLESLNKVEGYLIDGLNNIHNRIQILILLVRNKLVKKDSVSADKYFIELLNEAEIDDYTLSNFTAILDDYNRENFQVSVSLLETIESKLKIDNIYSQLLFYYTKTISEKKKLNEQEVTEILKISNLDLTSFSSFVLGKILFHNEKYIECCQVLKPFIQTNRLSETLLIYVNALTNISGEYDEIFKILNEVRQNRLFYYSFLRWEIDVNLRLNQWEKALELTSYGLEFQPNNDLFINKRMIALFYLNRIEELKTMLSHINYLDYNYSFIEEYSKISNKIGNLKEAIESSYYLSEQDSKYNDLFINQYLLSGIAESSVEMSIEKSNFVVLKIGEVEYTHEVKNDEFSVCLLGKRVGDIFNFTNQKTSKTAKVEIIDILSKYRFKAKDLMGDIDNPIKSLSMHSFKFEEGNINSFIETLIKFGGDSGSKRSQIINDKYSQYKNQQTSFGELIATIGANHFFDIYIHLIKGEGNLFHNVPLIPIELNDIKDKPIVIDISVICLLFMLEKENIYKSNQKFYISSFTKGIIRNLTIDENIVDNDVIKVNISNNEVQGNLYSKEYVNSRYKTFEELLAWVEVNTISINSNFALEILKANDGKSGYQSDSIQATFDNVGLAQSGYLLVTDDYFYLRVVQLQQTEVTGSLFLFVDTNFKKQVNDFLARNNYTVFELNLDSLLIEFSKHLNNEPNTYNQLIQKTNVRSSFSVNNISVGVEMIKQIAQNLSLEENIKEHEIKNIFINIINGNDNNVIGFLNACLLKTFAQNNLLLKYVVSICNSLFEP